MSKKYRIPVTVIESKTTSAYVVFEIDGDTEQEQMDNILKLETMSEEELDSKLAPGIKPMVDINKFPPQFQKANYVHVMDAEPF